ncbi:MAG: PHP domain-containing protein [Erysipelotrichaceae bacterium]|nr:PHP domain-containing protein [Erysipelotrichaceae bacterium]
MHSCLSPCAENEMTPNNICNMAMIKELDIIAVTDHNSTRQLRSVAKVAESIGLKMLYGVELESSEEVHVLGLFAGLEDAESLQEWIDSVMPGIPNRPDYFGDQLIMDENDEVIGKEDDLLIVSLQADLAECVEQIHRHGGKAILAHVLDRANSVTNQLGFIPMDLDYDGLEVKSLEQKQRVLNMHPWIKEDSTFWFIDSDAHRLTDISEPENVITHEEIRRLWGDVV